MRANRCLLLLGVVSLLCSLGCIQRTMVIRSEPSGAPVWVDQTYVGRTPVNLPFVFYGFRKVQVGPIRGEAEEPAVKTPAAEERKPQEAAAPATETAAETRPEGSEAEKEIKMDDGRPIKEVVGRKVTYRKVVQLVDVKAPLWDRFPLDFFSNCLWPFPVHHKAEFDFKLKPAAAEPEGMAEAERAKKVYKRAELFRQRAASAVPENLPPLP